METENKSSNANTVFTLSKPEDLSIALLCFTIYKGFMETKAIYINHLEGEYQESLVKLMDRVFALAQNEIEHEEDEENGDDNDGYDDNDDNNIPLNYIEGFGLLHTIVQTFYYLKRTIDLPAEKKATMDDQWLANVEATFNDMKENAADLLWRLTEVLYYTDYGLQFLEEVFDLKPAVRQMKVDKTREISTLTINNDNLHLFSWTFTLLNYLEFCQDIYEFARRLYACQYIHISDYNYISNKLKDCKVGDEFPFTLYDTLCLYYSVTLCARLFATDAADLMIDLEKRMSEEKTEYTVTLTQVRDFFLKFSTTFLSDVKTLLAKNKEFQKEIKVIEKWEM